MFSKETTNIFWEINIDTCQNQVVVSSLSCVRLCDLMDCSLPGFSVHWISQPRILEWGAYPFSSDLPDPGIEPGFHGLAAGFFHCWAKIKGDMQIGNCCSGDERRVIGNKESEITDQVPSPHLFLSVGPIAHWCFTWWELGALNRVHAQSLDLDWMGSFRIRKRFLNYSITWNTIQRLKGDFQRVRLRQRGDKIKLSL